MQADPVQREAEEALKRIATACRSSIDDVLDILTQLPRRERPGACMLCYFNLYRKLPPRMLDDLTWVKAWLEREIEIVATDGSSKVLESFPCQIAENELADFCHRMMEETKALLKPGMDKLVLEFRFAG